MSDKPDKKRFSLTLTPAYVENLNYLIGLGIFLDHQDAIRDFMRHEFQRYGLEPFTAPEQPEETR